jgi:tetratricopeptide (TPR) repeat protein
MDNLEYIDTYFGGGLPPEETGQFDKRIREDPAFAEEVSWYLAAHAALQEANREERKTRFRELYRREAVPPTTAKLFSRGWLKVGVAAAVLALIVLSWVFFIRTPDASALADRYIRQNLAVLPLKMGKTDHIQTGIALYDSAKFSDALREFESLLRSDSLNATALLDAGIVSLRMENYDKALKYLMTAQNHTDPEVNPALFYTSLTLLRRNHPGDKDAAKQQLRRIVRENLNKKEDARELLSKM